MLRQELQAYFDTLVPAPKIETEESIAGNVTIKFDLLEDDNADTDTRIKLAQERSLEIFIELFKCSDSPLWLLAYEYIESDSIGYSSDYLFQQLPQNISAKFYNETELVNTSMHAADEHGVELFEKVKANILIVKVYFTEINIKNIAEGILNRNNELEPIITQNIYFFDSVNKTGFHMYDDRGCFAWSESPSTLHNIYHKHINWVDEDIKLDIEEYFK